jgi:hypothetical protein
MQQDSWNLVHSSSATSEYVLKERIPSRCISAVTYHNFYVLPARPTGQNESTRLP